MKIDNQTLQIEITSAPAKGSWPSSTTKSSTSMGRRPAAAPRSPPRIWQKGLEFRAVVVIACDDEVILQLQARIETATDPGGLAVV